MFDFYPVSVQVQINNMSIGQRGLFYDRGLKTLIIGVIKETGLRGRVIHNGLTQKDYNEGRYFSAWNIGYTYDKWCIHDLEYVGTYRAYTSLSGYLEFIETASYDQLKDYFSAKELLKDIKKI